MSGVTCADFEFCDEFLTSDILFGYMRCQVDV